MSPVVRHDRLLCFDNNVTEWGTAGLEDQIEVLLGEEVNDKTGDCFDRGIFHALISC